MNIYADATKDLKEKEFAAFSDYMEKVSDNQEQETDAENKESMIIEVTQVGKKAWFIERQEALFYYKNKKIYEKAGGI